MTGVDSLPEVSNTPRLHDFAAYMIERHKIYLKRKAGLPGPWTDDPVLANGRFCNIYRELDTVTQWIEENIRQPYALHQNLWLMLAIARYINWPDTLQFLFDTAAMPTGDSWTPAVLTRSLEDRAAEGHKVYTGAYMIRAESNQNAHWYSWTKHRYIAEIVIGRLWEKEEYFHDLFLYESIMNESFRQASLQEVWTWFQQKDFIGWGPFMAYEVVTDLRHTRYLRDAPDIYTWANAGPGAIRGLNRLFGRDLNAKPKPEQTNQEMFQLMLNLNDLDGEEFNDVFGLPVDTDPPRFEMRDVEHTLCEFDKYERVRLGEGQMRSKYDWRNATTLK